MKNALRFVAALALIFTIVSCHREDFVPIDSAVPTHTVEFTTHSSDTRTDMHIEGSVATFSWSEGDIDRFKVWEDGIRGTVDKQNSHIEDGVLTIYATFEGEESGSEKRYTAVLGGRVGDQSPREDSYDENADILIAKPITATPRQGVKFEFRRPVAIHKMTLSGFEAGETLSKVTVRSDRPLTGTFDGEGNLTETCNLLNLSVDRPVSQNGDILIYFTSLPAQNATFIVNASAGNKMYQKSFGRGLTTTSGNVKVYSASLHEVLVEEFNATNAGSNKYGCNSELSTAGNDQGLNHSWTPREKVFVFQNGIRLATSGDAGAISNSTMLEGIPEGHIVTLTLYAALWGSDKGSLTLSYNGQSRSKEPVSQPIASPDNKDYNPADFTAPTTFSFAKASSNEFTLSAAANKRIIIDRIEVSSTAPSDIPSYSSGGWLELPAETSADLTLHYGHFGEGNNRNYSYCYNTNLYASLWTAYPLAYSHTQGDLEHSSSWHFNPDLLEEEQIDITSHSYATNYNNAMYARGHMCPNADRKSSKEMNQQTYYATNQLPQIQEKFNAGIWSSLEAAVRDLLTNADADTVYVAAGPCYSKKGCNETITYLTAKEGIHPSQVPVPNYFYKVLLKVRRSGTGITDAKAIGFWFEHKTYENGADYLNYTQSVDQIEEWTGINFFASLPESLQTSAEANNNWATFKNF